MIFSQKKLSIDPLEHYLKLKGKVKRDSGCPGGEGNYGFNSFNFMTFMLLVYNIVTNVNNNLNNNNNNANKNNINAINQVGGRLNYMLLYLSIFVRISQQSKGRNKVFSMTQADRQLA